MNPILGSHPPRRHWRRSRGHQSRRRSRSTAASAASERSRSTCRGRNWRVDAHEPLRNEQKRQEPEVADRCVKQPARYSGKPKPLGGPRNCREDRHEPAEEPEKPKVMENRRAYQVEACSGSVHGPSVGIEKPSVSLDEPASRTRGGCAALRCVTLRLRDWLKHTPDLGAPCVQVGLGADGDLEQSLR